MSKVVRFKRRRKKPPNARRSRRWISRGSWIAIAAILLAGVTVYYSSDLLPNSAAGSEASLTGRASVIDGDTIEIHGERVRFNGIDAPESSQFCKDRNEQPYRCGAMSADAVDRFLAASSPTRCDFVERDRYERFVGNCYRADGLSVAAAIVRKGWAMDWPRYSGGAYAEQQEAAKAERLGIWAGTFQPPWEWRAEQRQEQPAQIVPLVSATPAAGNASCDIKGNIGAKGERIYHVLGQEHYAKTTIAESKGERWFCSESEARAAGWRAAKR